MNLPATQTLQLSYALENIPIVDQSVIQSALAHSSLVSRFSHNQKDSNLCWAFSISTVIRGELKRLILNLANRNYISAQLKEDALKWADQINKENRLVKELVCLVNPRSPKLEDFYQNRSSLQVARTTTIFERICYPGLLRPAGWKMLPSVRRVTDLLTGVNSGISEIHFHPDNYLHPK